MKSKLILAIVLVLSGDCIGAIVYPKAPDGGRQLVFEKSGIMLREYPDGTAVSVRGLRIEDVTIAEPHRWYSVGATNLAAGYLLSAAASSSWRYLLIQGTNAVGVATVLDANAKTGEALRFGALYKPVFPLKHWRRCERQRNCRELEGRTMNFVLTVPAINFVAVWLHGKSDDIILPLPPTFGRKLNAYQPYSESEIIKVLEPEAKAVMKPPRLYR